VDTDPYLVITDAGRLVWMIDGYTTSDAHPYSRAVDVPDMAASTTSQRVKATVDAYDGKRTLHLRADDPSSTPTSASSRPVPPGVGHAGGSAGAHSLSRNPVSRPGEIYRTYHMLDPQSFYNKEDLWTWRATPVPRAAAPKR